MNNIKQESADKIELIAIL